MQFHQSIISFTSVIEIPAGITSVSFTLVFSLATGIIKELLKVTRKKMKKHNKILMLAKSKLNSIETLMSQTLIDLDISHENVKQFLIKKNKFTSYYITIFFRAWKAKTRITKLWQKPAS